MKKHSIKMHLSQMEVLISLIHSFVVGKIATSYDDVLLFCTLRALYQRMQQKANNAPYNKDFKFTLKICEAAALIILFDEIMESVEGYTQAVVLKINYELLNQFPIWNTSN